MPTVNLNRKEFENLLGKKIPDIQLKDRISMLGTDLESISRDEIIVEIFPNRPDMLSEPGFARAFASFIGLRPGLKNYTVRSSNETVIIDKAVKKVRPYTSCGIVKGLKLNEDKVNEIIHMQEKLHTTYGRNRNKVAIGIYPMEKLKFPIKFTAKKPADINFMPLGASKNMSAKEILEIHPAGKEYSKLLEGNPVYPLFIDANDKILSMPPIINSEAVGRVNSSTKDVFVECSGYDTAVLDKCLNMIITALADMGGSIYSLQIKDDKTRFTPNLTPGEMPLNLAYINKILGISITLPEAARLLGLMGYGMKKEIVLIPAWRADILHQADLAEDIAIAYGYENIPEEIPHVATVAEELKNSKLASILGEIMVGLGFQEVKSYHLSSEKELRENMMSNASAVKLKNAILDYSSLRNSILPGILKILAQNQHNDYPQELYEFGTTFHFDKTDELGVKEKTALGIVLCKESADFTSIKRVIEVMFKLIGLKTSFEDYSSGSFIAGRCVKVLSNGKTLAVFGEIHPQVLSNWNLTTPVAAAEIDLDVLIELLNM